MIRAVILIMVLCAALAGRAQKVTVRATDAPAATVFREIVKQTGKNFVYSSELLKDRKVTVNAVNRPLKGVLSEMFAGTDIEFKIKGNDVILKRRKASKKEARRITVTHIAPGRRIKPQSTLDTMRLNEVIVTSRLEAPAIETTEIGAQKITAEEVRNTPTLFGENDVMKTLQMQPGVSDDTEGLAAMHVHGGGSDENLCMLDNVPVYQVNHFAGLFSAFNTDIIRYIDFYKSSVPAKFDGRLSSFMDVRLANGNRDGHHGTARLGLTSGAFNISGPIGGKTTYLIGLRRSWFDVLTAPAMAIINSSADNSEKTRFGYNFTDLNAKLTHRVSPDLNFFVSAYYGNDKLKTGSEDKYDWDYGWYDNDRYDYNWGNLVAQAGANYRISPSLSSEFTAAYTRFFSTMKHNEEYDYTDETGRTETSTRMKTDNNINDWIFRGDFTLRTTDSDCLRFGANYVRHSFLPSRTARKYTFNSTAIDSRDSTVAYRANEFNGYAEYEWRPADKFSANAGLHGSLFYIDGKLRHGLSPRLSMSWRFSDEWAVKGAYTRTVQYVHQLSQSYLSLPTDQWIPVMGKFKPQTADKVSAGVYWMPAESNFAFSAEAYWKEMHNLVDYRDEYYLRPPLEMWNARLTSGRGTAKGLDFKIEKTAGRLTGHLSYSLAWADRQFREKNGGEKYPARFDHRHTINLQLNWHISDRVDLNAAWTGHSGNRFTLMTQTWETPDFGIRYHEGEEVPLRCRINNYQLPFYHRLDLSVSVKNKHGYWNFGLYNAYCHMNTIAVKRDYRFDFVITPEGGTYESVPVFQKVKMLPILPSISYTWQF